MPGSLLQMLQCMPVEKRLSCCMYRKVERYALMPNMKHPMARMVNQVSGMEKIFFMAAEWVFVSSK